MKPDTIDAASELEEMQRAQAIANMRLDRNSVSATHCSGCEEELSEPRCSAYPGCTMCVSCQADAEKRGKHQR